MEQEKQIHTEVVDIDDLIQDDHNFNKGTEAGAELIGRSFKEHGAGRSVFIDKNNRLVGGNKAQKGFKGAGYRKVVIVDSDPDTLVAVRRKDVDLDTKEGREMAMLDNLTTQVNLAWDKAELESISDQVEGFDVGDFGFEIDDLPQVVMPTDKQGEGEGEPQTEVKEDDFDPDAQYETKVKAGEVWQLGEHRLMCGDSTSAEDVAKLMNGERADMVLSDPPYGMKLDTDFSSIKGSLNSIGRKNHTEGNKYERVIGDNDDFTPALITTFFDNLGYCHEMFLFGADYFAEILPNKNDGSWLVWDKRKESQADAIGAEFELIWSRKKHKRRMLRHDWFGFLSSQNGADARNRVHPTQKPVTLLGDIITQWGDKADIITDLYGGSGSTMIACEQLGRKCRMMELDPHYCTVIIARWEKLTGQKAIKLNQ